VVLDGFAVRTPLVIQGIAFFIQGIAFRLDLFVQLVEIFAGAIQDAVEGGDLLTIEFDRSGKIGHVLLPPLIRTQFFGGAAGILTGLYRTDGIEPVGKRSKHCPAEKH